MATTTKTNTRHTTVTLKLPLGVSALVTYSQNIVKRMTANPAFPNPTPSLAAITQAVDDLQAAEAAALSRLKGAVATRNDKRTALVLLLKQLRGHIQSVADASTDNGAAIIESAGVAVRKVTTRRARTFTAKPGAVSGSVKVIPPRRVTARRTSGSTASTAARRGSPRRPRCKPKRSSRASRRGRPCSSSPARSPRRARATGASRCRS